MYLTIIEVIYSSIILSLLLGAIQWLIAIWIKSRLENSIKHEYDKKLEEFKFSIYQREQAAGIAKLFAKWAKYGGKEDELLNDDKKRDHFEELTKLNWELAMWIRDEKIVKKINERLSNRNNADDARQIVLDIRSIILGKEVKELKFSELVYFKSSKD